MSLPLELQADLGLVAVYGMGTTVSSSGFSLINNTSDVRFGQVYQVYSGSVDVYAGDNVIFRDSDVFFRVTYSDYPYTFVQGRLVTVEVPLP